MKPNFLFKFIFLFFVSCSVDYEMEKSFENEPDRITVNSFLNSSKPIRIKLYRMLKDNNAYIFKGLTDAHIVLKEDEKILFDDFCPDSILSIGYLPHPGAIYSIEVSCKGMATVKARTTVPEAINCKPYFTFPDEYWDISKYLVKLDSFSIPSSDRVSLWITTYKMYENNDIIQYNELYTNNLFVDKTNRVAGMDIKNEVVGSIYYDGFLRFKQKNLSHLGMLIFTPNFVYSSGVVMPDSRQKSIMVKLITASAEYDQYNKTLFEQKSMIVYDNDISSIFYQPKSVYCNIENGLGIFAGMSEVDYMCELPKTDD